MSDLQLRDLRIKPKGRGVEVSIFSSATSKACSRISIEHDGSVSVNRAVAVERNMLLLLDSISPEIRRAVAEFERYQAMPKIGEGKR